MNTATIPRDCMKRRIIVLVYTHKVLVYTQKKTIEGLFNWHLESWAYASNFVLFASFIIHSQGVNNVQLLWGSEPISLLGTARSLNEKMLIILSHSDC